MIFDYLKIFSAIIFFGVLPGFSILYLFIRPKFKLTAVEYMAFCVAISVTAVNFCVLFMDWLGISLSASHLMNAMFFVITIPLVASTFPSLKTTFMPVAGPLKKNKEPAPDFPSYLKPNKKQLIFSILIIGVSFFILTWFLAVDIVPNNTDLGHHMYWARQIADQERIVEYDTSDVIVGEHIIFAVVSKVTGISILSAFPVIILLLVGAAGFLAVVALALRVFRDQWIGWMAFLMIGVLYVAADPFGKFISGGVIGNTMGNLFIPLVLLSVYLAIKQRRSEFLALALFLFAGIFYIHHLSVFLLMFILLFGFLMYLGLGFLGKRAWKEKNKRFLKKIQRLGKLALNPLPIGVLVFFLGLLFVIHAPFYFSDKAIETVIQAPQKDTHQGVALPGFISSIGESRTILGILGFLMLLIVAIKKKNYEKYYFSLLIGWTAILLGLCFFPGIFMVDLPSRRVVNYLAAPFSILSAYFMVKMFFVFRKRTNSRLFVLGFLAFVLALSLNGYSGSLKYFRNSNQFKETAELYHAARYLAPRTDANDVILKDHANLEADNWLKFFFGRGYNYFLSRTFDYKYEDDPKRDPCPYYMALAPDSVSGLECYQKTKTGYVILKKQVDNFFFDLSDNFSKIYENDGVVIYRREQSANNN